MTDERPAVPSESPQQRVHRLASLGGLVVLAGLDALAPDLLLGILLEIGGHLPRLAPQRVEELTERGAARLRARHAEKRTWTAYRNSRAAYRVDLSAEELRALLRALGLRPATDPRALVPELRAALARITRAPRERES